jgi:hypothetical protein
MMSLAFVLYSSVAGKAGVCPCWGLELSPYALYGENTALWDVESRFHTCEKKTDKPTFWQYNLGLHHYI